jgi:hypothetical protein
VKTTVEKIWFFNNNFLNKKSCQLL